MKKIAIISSGYFPVPAVKGGAVETLLQLLADENEIDKKMHINIFSMFDTDAYRNSNKYRNSKFIFIKTPKIIEYIDKIIYYIVNNILKHSRHMSFRYIFKRIYYIYSVAQNLKNNNFDEIVIENTATLFWTLKLFNNDKKYSNRYIYHIHNIVEKHFGCKKIILKSKQVIGVSSYINKSFKEKFSEYPSEKMMVLKNCIDTEKINCNNKYDVRKKYGINDNDVLFIFVGRLCKEKGIKEVLIAFSKCKLKNAKLIVVGNYYFGTDIQSEFEKELYYLSQSIKDRVIFTGFVHNDFLGNYYAAADIAILPSIWEEPAGLTIVEAMACGLPIITTNSGGIPEYVDSDCSILINKKNDVIGELVKAIQLLYNDENLRNKMKINAFIKSKEYIKKNYLINFNEIIN